MKLADWEAYVFEIGFWKKLHSGREHKTVFLQHGLQGTFCVVNLGRIIIAEMGDFSIRINFFERANGYIGVVFL